MKEEINKWMKKAEHDLNTAKVNFHEKIYDAAAFYSQQAVEKALKSLHIKTFSEVVKTHDLVFLSKKLDLPDKLKDFCKELSPAYTYTRYPDVIDIKNLDDVSKKLIEYAEEVLEWAKKKL